MNNKTRDFIERNLTADVRQLALKGCRDKEVDFDIALRQIAGRQIAHKKLPSWAAHNDIVYPPHLNLEQCSSEQTARYKTDICRRLFFSIVPPTSFVDLTGGFGVDFAFMSEVFDETTYVERDSELFTISSENLKLLAPKARCVNSDGVEVLHELNHVSMIFMDPARRDSHGARTYGISDCTPDVLAIKEELLQKADIVMLKLSPMLDWRKAISDLGEQYIKEVHIVSVQNECKELLVLMQRQHITDLVVYCVNDDSTFSYHPSASNTIHISQPPSLIYLYEPNASLMKAGCFAEIEQAFGINQLAPNSHLFTSDKIINDFPGRKFRITTISSMNKQELKTTLKDIHQANITVRNFPLTVPELRKKLKCSDGGEIYIFATTLTNKQRILIICSKLNSVNTN